MSSGTDPRPHPCPSLTPAVAWTSILRGPARFGVPKPSVPSSASTPRDGICWQVRQLFRDTGLPGRFLLQARGARGAVDVVVGETDYRSFAILYLERARQLSVKLYARSLPVSESALSVFEQRVQGANLTEDHILFFPKYGFCDAADQFHVLDEAKQ